MIRSWGVTGQRAVYVGDVVAARQAGMDIAAVTWGYNSRELLAVQEPDYLIDSPDELRTLLGGPAAGGQPP
jgi:phosphoglycolate phosphatase-like HAD superfamily hydrolase